MLISTQLLKEVWKEFRLFPKHAYRVVHTKLTQKVLAHQKYAFGKHRKQYFCWFEPNENTKNEIILFYHGGGWTFGTPELFSDRAKIFVQLGYHVIMPSHRKLPFNNYQQIKEDLMLTLKKLEQIKNEKGLGDQKIILGGMSSGGNLAALILLDSALWQYTSFQSADFIAAFLCAPPLYLGQMTDSFVLYNYAGKKGAKMFKQASPIHHLPTKFSKPLLIIHGTNDGLVKYESNLAFVKELEKRKSTSFDFYTIPNGSHLDSVSWTYQNNALRKKILEWLKVNST